MDRIAVVFNPSKSLEKLQAYLESIEKRFGIDRVRAELYVSRSPADLPNQARRAIDDGHRIVVAAGGDGTVYGVLNGIYGSDAIVSVAPLGTSNDFATSLRICSVQDAVDALHDGSIKQVDIGRGSYVDRENRQRSSLFCSSAGVGFSAAIAKSELSFPMPLLKRYLGNGAFVLSSLKHLATFKVSMADILLDTTSLQAPMGFIEICKVASVGGMPLAPFAQLDNGFLDACLVGDMALRRRIQLLLTAQFSSSHIRWDDVEYFTHDAAYNQGAVRCVRRIEVSTRAPMPVHLNGDFVGYTPAVFEIVPATMSVLSAR
jgi:diacylglycerol kinase (ATP)